MTTNSDTSPSAGKWLDISAKSWFAVAFVGQWLFALYAAVYFGSKIVGSGLPGLAETQLLGGHVAGDMIGNIAVAAHVLIAVIIHGGGPLQLIPQVRNRFPLFHRINGRAFMVAAFIAAASGLYIVWVRGSQEGAVADITNTIDAALIFAFGALALRYAIKRDIRTHRRWALRLFLAVSAVWFVRLGIYGTMVSTMPFGISFRDIYPQTFIIVHLAKFAVPLAILEIYLRAQDRPRDAAGVRAKYMAAGFVFVATAATALGVGAVAVMGWLPKIFA